MAHKEGFLRDMDLLYQQAKEAKEARLALDREYEQRVYEARMKREASQRAANEEHRLWRTQRDRLSKPYTPEAEARRVAPLEEEEKVLRLASLKYAEEQEGKRRKTSSSSSGGRRMKYKSTRRRSKSTRRRGKTNRRRVKTHRRRHRKH
jgi:hypothetical protein